MLINTYMQPGFDIRNGMTVMPSPMMVRIRGKVMASNDPMYRGNDGDPVVKTLPAADLPDTVERWLSLRREITGIEEV